MKKLVIAAMALALSAGVNAQDEQASGSSAGTIGGVATTTIAAGVVGIAVAAAVISNNRGTSVTQPPELCDDGTEPVNGVCTGNTITVTGTGTNTTTATATVTVTSTI
ncbi:hypothetical protein J2X32_002701 [Rheinheimera pacifica]|uniref:hypothetical protein n=1 Tax=Rheinheimera pacifica TaxID=173990 RepID=UPI00285AB2CC|nr:hypothetical protein [Rheinheimera pacifica]MDR6984059.1 hypothetical protein [Rheinheimera pacifica]